MKRLTLLPAPCALRIPALRPTAPAVLVAALLGAARLVSASDGASAQSPDFNRVIRPILSENCYKCHGPDDGARKSNLRFDLRAAALGPAKSGRVPIVP